MRQYVGARYVPKIYTNSLNPGSNDWESGVVYEPLTIVNYNTTSYTSKKPVPSTVGDPASNPDYWVETGSYNGQIANLQNQINTLNTIGKNRKFLLIGDSLGIGTSFITGQGYVDGKGWVGWCMDYIGTDRCVWAAINGGGFTEPTPYQWLYQLQNVNLGTHIPEEFTDLIILGGSNDIDDTTLNIKTAIGNLVSYAKTTFPNLDRIAIGALAEPQHIDKIRERYIQCIDFGCEYISSLENLLCDASMYDDTKHTHLSQIGYQLYSPWICEAVLCGRSDYKFTFKKPLSIHQKIPNWVSVSSGYQDAYIEYIITADSVDIKLLPASDYPAAYNEGDVTVYDLTGWGYPAGAHPNILSCGPNPILYDNTDSVYCIGFLGDAEARTGVATPLIDTSGKIIGFATFSFFDYRIDYWGGVDPYKLTINMEPTFFDASQGTGTGPFSFTVGTPAKCSYHRS